MVKIRENLVNVVCEPPLKGFSLNDIFKKRILVRFSENELKKKLQTKLGTFEAEII